MKHILAGLASMLSVIALVSCGTGSSPTPGFTATPTPDAPTSTVPAVVPTPNAQHVDVFCPTDNEEARQSYNEANLLAKRGKTEQAREAFLQALELDPSYCDAMDNLGLLLRAEGEIEEAIKWYKRSIQIKPDNTVAHLNLAAAYSLLNQIPQAREEYQKLIELAPENPEGYFGMGKIYLDLKQPAEAIPMLKKAEALYEQQSSPWITDARFMLGYAHFLSEEYSKAVDYLNLAYPQMADDPRVNYLLGVSCLSSELKDVEQARKYLGRARDLGMALSPELTQVLEK